MEFELELDFSRVNPLRANVSVTDSQLRQKERAAFLNDSDSLSANRSALVCVRALFFCDEGLRLEAPLTDAHGLRIVRAAARGLRIVRAAARGLRIVRGGLHPRQVRRALSRSRGSTPKAATRRDAARDHQPLDPVCRRARDVDLALQTRAQPDLVVLVHDHDPDPRSGFR